MSTGAILRLCAAVVRHDFARDDGDFPDATREAFVELAVAARQELDEMRMELRHLTELDALRAEMERWKASTLKWREEVTVQFAEQTVPARAQRDALRAWVARAREAMGVAVEAMMGCRDYGHTVASADLRAVLADAPKEEP